MKLKSLLLLLFAFASLNFVNLQSDPDERLIGTWHGIADMENAFSMVFDVVDGEFTGSVSIPGQGMVDMPLTEMSVEDDKFEGSFDLGGIILKIYGTIKEDGTVTGSYDMGDSFGTYEMEREES